MLRQQANKPPGQEKGSAPWDCRRVERWTPLLFSEQRKGRWNGKEKSPGKPVTITDDEGGIEIMRYVKGIFLLVVLVALSSCAPPVSVIYWPLPPAQPRIKFQKSITGAAGFFGVSAADMLLGSSPLAGSFVKPLNVYIDHNDTLYMTDTGSGQVLIFDVKAKKAVPLTTYGRSVFVKPVGVVVDDEGTIYVSDSQIDKIFLFDVDRKFVKAYGMNGEFKQPAGLALDNKRKRLYVVDTHQHKVLVLDKDTGKEIMTIGVRGNRAGQFNFPSYVTLNPKGNVFVVDTMNGRVQEFDPKGRFVRMWGKLGDAPGMFARPKGIGMDSEGHVYVVDAAFNNIQIFSEEGEILMAFGEYGIGRGEQILPAGLAIDSEDRIYVIDQWNQRINVYEFMGEKYRARQGGK
jgi:DNA-binding beta-propeller fold protein YncE